MDAFYLMILSIIRSFYARFGPLKNLMQDYSIERIKVKENAMGVLMPYQFLGLDFSHKSACNRSLYSLDVCIQGTGGVT